MVLFLSLALKLLIVLLIISRRELDHQSVGRFLWNDNRYDFIVIGSGSSGAIVAKRLAENRNIKVLLIEAGIPQSFITDIPKACIFLQNSVYDWKYKTIEQKFLANRTLSQSRGKVIGGTSSINGMVYNRGNKKDFDNWNKTYGAKGWSYEEVLPYFIKSENNSDPTIVSENPGYHGTDGPVGVSSITNLDPIYFVYQQSIHEMGLNTTDANGGQQLGTRPTQSTIKDGLRSSTGNAYIDPNPYPNNLHILTEAICTKILFNESSGGPIASGVQFIKSGTTTNVYVNKEVILSAGVIGSPQILMLSGVGPKDHLKEKGIQLIADLPVGDNFQDHIHLKITSLLKNNSLVNNFPLFTTQQLYELYVEKSGPLSQFFQYLTYNSTKNNTDKEWPNTLISALAFKYTIDPQDFISNLDVLLKAIPIVGFVIDSFVEKLRKNLGLSIFLTTSALVRVRSVGTIRLKSNDPSEYPLIDPKYLSDSQDLEDFIEAIKLMYIILENSSFASQVIIIPTAIDKCGYLFSTPIYKNDLYIRCLIREMTESDYHPAGSCRMGSIDRKDVVVDERLRVKNVTNLRVIDCSIMPELVNANTNAAAMMIGEKGADMIKQDHSI